MALDVSATVTRSNPKRPSAASYWAVTGADDDSQTAEIIRAAPGSGYSLYITYVLMSWLDADAVPRLQDEDDTLLFGPWNGSGANAPLVIEHEFKMPVKLTANKALELKCAAAGTVSFYIEGFTAP